VLGAGADVNAEDLDEQTPLHRAALGNAPEVAKVLLAHGAQVNARDNDGWTPLHLAALNNKPQVARSCWRTGPKSMRATMTVAQR
jgi:ankyrin repeat protein